MTMFRHRRLRPDAAPSNRIGLTDLLIRLRDQDAEQDWESLISMIGRVLQAVCRENLSDPVLIEDGVQDALMRIRSQLPTFEARSTGESWAWVRAIAKGVCVNRLRSEQSRSAREHIYASEQNPASTSDQDEILDEGLPTRHRELATAISGLPDVQRRIIELRFFYGHNRREIGAILGLEVDAVSRILRAAIRSLRRVLPVGQGAAPMLVLFASFTERSAETLMIACRGAENPPGPGGAVPPDPKPLPTEIPHRIGHRIVLGSAILIGSLGLIGVLAWLFGAGGPSGGPDLVVVEATDGTTVQDGTRWLPIRSGTTLHAGSRLRTPAKGGATLQLGTQAVLTLRESSEVLVRSSAPGNDGNPLRLQMDHGALAVRAALPAGRLLLSTPHSSAPITRFDGFVMVVSAPAFTRWDVLAGGLDGIADHAGSSRYQLTAGQAATIGADSGWHSMPSDGREFSPRWGGRFFRSAGDSYLSGRMVLDGVPDRELPHSRWTASGLLAGAKSDSTAHAAASVDGNVLRIEFPTDGARFSLAPAAITDAPRVQGFTYRYRLEWNSARGSDLKTGFQGAPRLTADLPMPIDGRSLDAVTDTQWHVYAVRAILVGRSPLGRPIVEVAGRVDAEAEVFNWRELVDGDRSYPLLWFGRAARLAIAEFSSSRAPP